MRKLFLVSAVVLMVITVVLAGCAAPSPASQKTWTLKMSHEQSETSIYHTRGHVPWVNEVQKATNGRVKIEIYPNQTLVKTADAWEGVKSGIVDVAWIFSGYFPSQFELLEAMALPFVSPTATVASKTAWALFQKFPEINTTSFGDIKVLSVWGVEPYYPITTKKQIKAVEDFKGMKLRATGGPATDMMKLLGGVPTMVPMPDCYLAMDKGVLDGMLAVSEPLLSFKQYEVVKYYTFLPTTSAEHMIIMNKKIWDGMPTDIQQAIMSVSGEKQSVIYATEVFEYARNSLKSTIEKAGYQMITYTPTKDDLDKFIAVAGKPVWDQWVTNMEAKGKTTARKILDETLRLEKEYSK